MKAQLVKGTALNSAQRQEVKAKFVHRFTGQHRPQWANTPRPDGSAYEPTHATDEEWINDHAFYIRKDEHIANTPRHCEPAFLAD